MKWSIHQLQKYRRGAMPLDEVVNLDVVKKRNPEIREISPVHVTGSCTIGAKKITCQFKLTGTFTLPCARTWEDVEYPFTIETNEQFTWDIDQVILDGDEEDEHVHRVEGEVVNPMPLFEELLLLEVPIQVVSKEAESVTNVEGKGWSYTTEEQLALLESEEKETKVDPRLASLAKFFETDK